MHQSNHHVFGTVTGYELKVIPYAPFRIRYGAYGANVLEVEHRDKYAQIIAENGGYRSKIAEGTESLFDVVDIESGLKKDTWMIDTSLFICHFPEGFWLYSTDGAVTPFDLVGPQNELIYFQSPRNIPKISEMVAPGQKVEDLKEEGAQKWIELSYPHDGTVYRQRHHVLNNLILTVQAPEKVFGDAVKVANVIIESLEFV